jgi:cAMP-dependent protein kinase regulator
VLVKGLCEVLIDGVGKVHEYDDVGAFGELALMYSSPRAATIRAATSVELFTLDLRTFR